MGNVTEYDETGHAWISPWAREVPLELRQEMQSKIISLCVMNSDGDVAVGLDPVRMSHEEARQLRLGDWVSVRSDNLWVNHRADAELKERDAALVIRARPDVDAPRGCFGGLKPPARPEAPAFHTATEHEIGIGHLNGHTYQYAYPKGATPADACRWSHIDETEVREEFWDIQPGDIVYDIGSAFGSYALSALAMGAARVVCFNPNPKEQELLFASACLNGWQEKVDRHNVGLWSESGYLNDEEQTFIPKGYGDFQVARTADNRHTQLFEVQTLDSLCLQPIGGRVVAKLDVEGAEAHVLRGARVFFAQHQPAFVTIEIHVFKSATIEQETDAAMADLGYVPVKKRPYHSVMHALYRMKGWDD